MMEDPRYLREQLITCIGNKRALLPHIERMIDEVKAALGAERLRMADLFAGSGVVARMMKQHASLLIANDLEAYSAVANRCYLANRSAVDRGALEAEWRGLCEAVAEENLAEGFITRLYAPKDDGAIAAGERVFYTRRNAMVLDSARRHLDSVAAEMRDYLMGPLLAEASVHANTAGVFKGFYKNGDGVGQFGGTGRDALARIMADIEIPLPVLSRFECEVQVHQRDACEVAGELEEVDLVYLDPPYNQHPYGSNYFMLNLLVDYEEPREISRVSGIPADWNRSVFNKRAEAQKALFDLVERCRARFVLVSYNSEGFVEKDAFLEALGRLGRVSITEVPYNTFRGSRNLNGRSAHVKEYLFLLDRGRERG